MLRSECNHFREQTTQKRATIARLKAWGKFALATTLLSFIVYADVDRKMHDIMQSRYGSDGVSLLDNWHHLVADVKSATSTEKLLQVNDFFNGNVRYMEDMTLWKKSDYWSTPLDTMGKQAGDCEDYTIAKYLSLLRLGIGNDHLRLIYVRAQIGGPHSKIFQAHMVLGYYATPDSIPLILDNLINTIESADKRTDLRPVFSFNSEGLWVGDQPTSADPTARLSRWRDLLARARDEGF